eukprot:c12792_g1_i1 orf=229-1185(-)
MAALCVPSSPVACTCSCCCSIPTNIDLPQSSSYSTASLHAPFAISFKDGSLSQPSGVKRSQMGSCRSPKLRPWKPARLSAPPLLLCVSANSKADDSLPSEMSFENALNILGVAEGASFEEILRAKNTVLSKHTEDQDMAIQVEAAYDVLLMESLMQRRAGKVVDNSIRYADVKKVKTVSSTGGPQWIRDAASKFPVAVETPSSGAIGTQTAIYAGLMVWTFTSGLSSESAFSTNAQVPGPILAIGFGASLYFLRKQNVQLGKAAALTLAGLIAGAVVGGAVESWLRVDLIPVFGIGSPSAVVSEFVLISLWLSSLFLR